MESRALERTVLPQKLILERISFILFAVSRPHNNSPPTHKTHGTSERNTVTYKDVTKDKVQLLGASILSLLSFNSASLEKYT
jgi:hypothetical protein